MAMARDGLLPPFFSEINKSTQVPVKSTIATGICAAILAFFMDVSQLAGMVSLISYKHLILLLISKHLLGLWYAKNTWKYSSCQML